MVDAKRKELLKDEERLLELGEKNLESLIDKTVDDILRNNGYIFEIYEQVCSEIVLLRSQLEEIEVEIAQLIPEVDARQRYEKHLRQSLMGASAKCNHQIANEIYLELEQVQRELREMDKKEKSYRKRRDSMQRRLIRFEEMEKKAKKSVSAIGAVATFLSTQIRGISVNLRELEGHVYIDEKIIGAHEYERLRISRELHDTVAQTLARTIQEVYICEMTMDRGMEKESRDALFNIKEGVKEGLANVRQAIFDMRPMSIDDQGILGAVYELTGVTSRKYGIAINYQVGKNPNAPFDDRNLPLSKAKEVAVYRIVQESLTNIIHHAEATKVDVNVLIARDALNVMIKDNGKGFDSDKLLNFTLKDINNEHFGVLGMIERAKQIGAEFTIRSKEGDGTTCRLRMPFIMAAE